MNAILGFTIMESVEKRTIYTIGHSTHEIKNCISLLKRHRVNAVADVRSVPYSRHYPQFNRENLIDSLRVHSIEYASWQGAWRAIRRKSRMLREWRVKYRLLARTKLFRRNRVGQRNRQQTQEDRFNGAEKDPLDCHRTILVHVN